MGPGSLKKLACGLGVVGLAVLPAMAAGSALRPRPVRVHVKPRSGEPDTRFRVVFRARNRAQGRWRYDVEATGPERDGCDFDTAVFVHSAIHERVRVIARAFRDNWCRGRYSGSVFLQGRGHDYVVGSFSFRVTRR